MHVSLLNTYTPVVKTRFLSKHLLLNSACSFWKMLTRSFFKRHFKTFANVFLILDFEVRRTFASSSCALGGKLEESCVFCRTRQARRLWNEPLVAAKGLDIAKIGTLRICTSPIYIQLKTAGKHFGWNRPHSGWANLNWKFMMWHQWCSIQPMLQRVNNFQLVRAFFSAATAAASNSGGKTCCSREGPELILKLTDYLLYSGNYQERETTKNTIRSSAKRFSGFQLPCYPARIFR